jgi:tape measure domain-containing protein
MGQASRSLTDFEREQQKLGGAADTTMGRLVQSARINEQEWTTVGRTLAVAGGAITGLGVAALHTGTQYNTLQQTSRAALTTLTGSAEEANAQMDKLDDFASNSPFAKQVFIEAQQQMLGFGIEAQKVIPYLGAIQDAVAATGGSNQDIAELSRIFSTIQSSAKLTATDLMEFGNRGVDAATLIGSQMGKTGAEIREEITAGTLDASEALDALAAGMDERFGGAAANVKDTFDGAVDRVKAAWRDLSSTLATPLVDPQGGGLLIDFFNMLADAMRALEAAPTWLQGAIVAITGLIGVAALAGGSLMIAVPRFVEFRTALETLSNTHPLLGRLTSGLSRFFGTVGRAAAVGTVLTVAAGGLIKLADALRDEGIPANANRVSSALAEVNGLDIDTLFLEATAGAYDLNDALANLMDLPFGHEWGMGVAETLGITSNASLNAKQTFEEIDATLSSLVEGGQTDKAAQLFELLAGSIDTSRFSVEDLEAMLPGYQEALDGAAAETELAAEASDELAGSFLGIRASSDDAASAMENWIELVSNAGASFGGILDAYDRVIEKQGETSTSTSQTMEEWIAELQAQAEAHSNWADNVVEAMEQANTETTGEAQEMHAAFVEEMTEAGIEGAAALQTFVDATPEQRAELVEAWMGTKDDIREVIEAGDDPQIGVEADTEPAFSDYGELVEHILGTTTLTGVDADTGAAEGTFDAMLREWAAEETDTNVDANVDPAESSTRELFNEWVTTTTPTNLDADSSKAQAEFNEQTYTWGGTTTATNLDANTSQASGAFAGVTNTWAATTTTTSINADTTPAQRAWDNFKSGVGAIYTSIVASVTGGNYHGGIVNPGRYTGGQVLPGRRAGGWVPGERAGYDNVMWPLHSGGQVLTQPLEGGEFVVRSSQAPNYTPELYAMNNGTFPTGMMERLYSSNAAGPSSIQVSAPPVDTAAIGAAVSAAIRSYQPVVQIGGHQFAGVMQEVHQQYVARR